MSKTLDFSLARAEDEADLRALLRQQALPGWINISFEREPEFFAAAAIEGEDAQVLIAREQQSRSLAGFCSRAVRRVFVNAQTQQLGYLGQFRSVKSWQNGYRTYRALSKGFATVAAQLHQQHELAFDITSILSDNLSAKRLLEADLPGMPHYQHYSGFNTLIYRSGGRGYKKNHPQIKLGSELGLSAISQFLQDNYRHYQFSPVWDLPALQSAGLSADNFLLFCDAQKIIACIAIWDQRHYKQAIVRGYKNPLAFFRPLINAFSPVFGLPYMPPVGQPLNQAWLSHLACQDNAHNALNILLNNALWRAKKMGLEQLMLGLADDHPFLSHAKRCRRHLSYHSDIYLIHWHKNTCSIDKRPLHLEVATL